MSATPLSPGLESALDRLKTRPSRLAQSRDRILHYQEVDFDRDQLTSADVEELATLDPTHRLTRGRIRARVEDTDRHDPIRRLADAMLAVEAPETTSYVNPCRFQATVLRAPLSAADIHWAETLSRDPKQVPGEEVRHLVELEAQAASTGSESERLLIARVLGPIRAHHDRLEETARLKATIARARSPLWPETLRRRAVDVLYDQVRSEETRELLRTRPELSPDARADLAAAAAGVACERMQARWKAADLARDMEARLARARLVELEKGTPPASSAPRQLPPRMTAGAARARAERSAEEDRRDPFAGMRVLGGA